MRKEIKYDEYQYEERQSMLYCPKCRSCYMMERWLRYLKKQTRYGVVPRKTHKPEAVWCPECKFVLNSIKQPNQNLNSK